MKGALFVVAAATCLLAPGHGQQVDCPNVWGDAGMNGFDVSSYCQVTCDGATLQDAKVPTTIHTLAFGSPIANCTNGVGGFRNVKISAVNPTVKMTGSIPAGGTPGSYTGLAGVGFAFEVDFSQNTLTGTIPDLAKANANLKRFTAEDNQLSDEIGAMLNGWHAGIQAVEVKGNLMTGDYNNAALYNFLVNRAALRAFSVTLTNPGNTCIRINEILDARDTAGNGRDLQIDVPAAATCAPTPVPSAPPSTGAPVPPTMNDPTGAPSSQPPFSQPTKHPTEQPTISPTNSVPSFGATRAPRTLAPDSASSLTVAISTFLALVAAVYF